MAQDPLTLWILGVVWLWGGGFSGGGIPQPLRFTPVPPVEAFDESV